MGKGKEKHYLFGLLIAGGKPFTCDLQLIVQLDRLHLALTALNGRELQAVVGHAEGWHDHRGTERDVKRWPKQDLEQTAEIIES